MYAETLITKILHKAALNTLTEETRILDPLPQVGNTFSSRHYSSSGTSYGRFKHQLEVENTSLSTTPLSSATPSPTPSAAGVENEEYLQQQVGNTFSPRIFSSTETPSLTSPPGGAGDQEDPQNARQLLTNFSNFYPM